MPLEIWILLALAVAAAIIGGIARLRRKRRAPETERNVYPLW